MTLIIEDIRTFHGRHEIPIRPLTILTGENSSGKSTLLACLSVVANRTSFPLEPAFNVPPYSLGTFETIASRFGKANSFALGWTRESSSKKVTSELARYRKFKGAIKLSEYRFSSEAGEIEVKYDEKLNQFVIAIRISGRRNPMRMTVDKFSQTGFRGDFPRQIFFQMLSRKTVRSFPWERVDALVNAETINETISIAPIRTRPERTYDLSSENTTPEGSHIPFVLARLLRETGSKGNQKVLQSLLKFGDESGLFRNINVRNLGRQEGDPFQLQANVSGRPTNLTDVGYGVSQSLPVVIESVLASKNKSVLVQQPEVHLHPRAQAALGSFFVDLVAADSKEFVVETHSDYVVDRIRQEVSKGRISPNAVTILYCCRKNAKSKVFPLSLDKDGNVLNAPVGYRDFFLRETMNLLTRG